MTPEPARSGGELWVCWKSPPRPPGHPHVVLSFLPPVEEAALRASHSGRFVSARETPTGLRRAAVDDYNEIVARIGLAPVAGGRTLRQSLRAPGGDSLWWYHPVAFKDCESDPALDHLLALKLIRSLSEEAPPAKIVLVGAPRPLRVVLQPTVWDRFALAIGGVAEMPRGLAARAKALATAWRARRAARRAQTGVAPGAEVAFQAFLPGNFDRTPEGRFHENYYGGVPDVLADDGVRSLWLVWLDSPRGRFADLERDARQLSNERAVVLLQGLLRRRELAARLLDARTWLVWLRACRRKDVRASFLLRGDNLYPLFARQLHRGFAGPDLGRQALLALAVERACLAHAPRASVTYLEHVPEARAFYAGSRRAGLRTRCAVQHASYNSQKSFLLMDPEREFRGEPDGCAMPRADRVFAMGSLGRELFLRCGYAATDVAATGAPRYDATSGAVPREPIPPDAEPRLRVLIVTGLDRGAALDMLEASCAAVESLPHASLRLREHPRGRVTTDARFAPLRGRVEVSRGSLPEDLSSCDAVVFTASTVAEEAYLAGLPVIHWVPTGFDGSALAEVADVMKAASPAELRSNLESILKAPASHGPTEEEKVFVESALFHRRDGGSTRRVAAALAETIRKAHREGGS